jgi:prolyl oligopeptidase
VLRKASIVCFLVFLIVIALHADEAKQTDTYHGIVVADPYRWLENAESPETKKWIQGQKQLFQDYNGDSGRNDIQERLTSLSVFDFYTTPVKANGIYFFTKTPEGETVTTLYKQTPGTEPEVILNPSKLGNGANITAFQPDPVGKRIACWISRGQTRWRELKIVKQDGTLETDSLTGLHALGGGIAWTKDGQGFYYIAFEQPKTGEENQSVVQNGKIFYHRIGENQSDDRRVYSRLDRSTWNFTVQVSDDGKYLVVTARDGGEPSNKILFRDLTDQKSDFKELMEGGAAYTYLGNRGLEFYFYTDNQAPNGRIISVDLNHPQKDHWKTIIPESTDAIAGGSLVGGNAVGYYGDRFVILYWKDGLPLVQSFDRTGKLRQTMELPEGSSIWGGISGTSTDEEVFYTLLTLTRPRTIYRWNLRTGHSEIFRSVDKDFNADDFITKHVFYKSHDGTRVPMFLVHKKGISLDGKNPLFIYGYGALGWNSFLWYQPHVLVWLERGGIYALPRIRGGGEYGESWHQAGIKQNKKNTIDDYIAAAEWLIDNRYTSPDRLIANGGSASAFVAAAAVMKRPDLFGAALIDIPFLDLLRYNQYTGGAQFAPEFGSIENRDEFQFLHSISPYHNVQSGKCYPAMLVRVGELDQVAVPMHGYKFVAAMQEHQKCDRPILLKVMRGAGHNFGTTPEQTVESNVDALVFMFRATAMESVTQNPAEPESISPRVNKPKRQ